MWTSSKEKNSVLVVIPAYNEAECIYNVVINLLNKCSFDYLIVNDGSTDQTELICKLNGFNFINHKINKGLSEAMRTGFNYALDKGYKYVAQYDSDGQHDPEDLKKIINYIKIHNIDIVCGSRFLNQRKRRHKNIFKEIARGIFSKLFFKMTNKTISDPTNGLRAYSSKFIEEYCANSKFEVEPSTIAYAISKKNMTFAEVPVVINKRIGGKSSFCSLSKIIKYIIKQFKAMAYNKKHWGNN